MSHVIKLTDHRLPTTLAWLCADVGASIRARHEAIVAAKSWHAKAFLRNGMAEYVDRLISWHPEVHA